MSATAAVKTHPTNAPDHNTRLRVKTIPCVNTAQGSPKAKPSSQWIVHGKDVQQRRYGSRQEVGQGRRSCSVCYAGSSTTTNGTSGPNRKLSNAAPHDPNHAKRSHSPELRTSSSSSSGEDSGDTTGTGTSSSSSATPAVAPAPASAPAPVVKPPEPSTLKGSGPNGELTLRTFPCRGSPSRR
nr:serine/arginine repetitive matrix protein 2-like [Aedes albopictus]